MSSNFSEEEGEEGSKIDSKDHYKRRVQFVDNHLCSSSSSSSSSGKKKGVLFYFTSKSSKKINWTTRSSGQIEKRDKRA